MFTPSVNSNTFVQKLISNHGEQSLPFLAKGPHKRTQQVKALLAQWCWELLALVGTCCVVHVNEHNNCQCYWRKLVILALITAFLSQAFPLSVYRPSHIFSLNNSLYLACPRGKSFPRKEQSAVPPRGICLYTSGQDSSKPHIVLVFDKISVM